MKDIDNIIPNSNNHCLKSVNNNVHFFYTLVPLYLVNYNLESALSSKEKPLNDLANKVSDYFSLSLLERLTNKVRLKKTSKTKEQKIALYLLN